MPRKTSSFYIGRRRAGDYQIGTSESFWDPRIGFAFTKFCGTITRDVVVRLFGLSLKPGMLAKVRAISVQHEIVRKEKQDVE